MRIIRTAFTGLLLAGALVGWSASQALTVRAIGNVTGCAGADSDGDVEIINSSGGWFKVEIFGVLSYGHGAVAACGNGLPCSHSFSLKDVVVGPCPLVVECPVDVGNLPSCCDNVHTGGSCNGSNRYCTSFDSLTVRITATSSDGFHWTDLDVTDCVIPNDGVHSTCRQQSICDGLTFPQTVCDYHDVHCGPDIGPDE